ncbi:hypothetical protein L1049_018682 [Liquidambar formosana]|uniref:Uncharacterized protein n=1 Tax=Liquidambar formosana TaxID=63359 RepID=A0AAP0RAF3_LIQFO
MVRSIPKYIDMTHTLLEFLFLLVDNYDVEQNHFIVRGVLSAFSILVRKGVVHSLDTLTSCDSLSPFLKERIGKLLKAGFSRESPLAQLPGQSVLPMSLPSLSSVAIETPIPGGPKESTLAHKVGFGAPVDGSTLILDDPVTSCSPLVESGKSQVDAIECLVQNLGETIRESYVMGLQTLEKILFSFAKLDNQRLSSDFVEVSSCKIAKEFELNGYKLFSPLEFFPNDPNCDAEIQSATAFLIRTLVFSQDERMLEMFLFWSRDGFPVGARLLSYASRLAYEAHMMGYLENSEFENSFIKVSDSEIPLLKFHADGYISYIGEGKDSPEAIGSASEMDSKFVTKLVDGAFSAYRCFLTYSINILHKEADTSSAKLLFSDLMSCSEWEHKRLKFLFCSVFLHLSDLSVGEEDFIQLLVDRLDNADLVNMQFEMGLEKFSIFGGNTETILHLIKSSLNWGSMEQHKFWGLLRSELAVSKVQVEKLILEFFCSGVLDPSVNAIAVGGLLTALQLSCAHARAGWGNHVST